jgi:hypothetical protein
VRQVAAASTILWLAGRVAFHVKYASSKVDRTRDRGDVWASKTASEEQEEELRVAFDEVLMSALDAVELVVEIVLGRIKQRIFDLEFLAAFHYLTLKPHVDTDASDSSRDNAAIALGHNFAEGFTKWRTTSFACRSGFLNCSSSDISSRGGRNDRSKR